MHDEQNLKIVTVPSDPYVFGDARFRVLYGPENDHGVRPIIGLIAEAHVSAIEAALESAGEEP